MTLCIGVDIHASSTNTQLSGHRRGTINRAEVDHEQDDVREFHSGSPRVSKLTIWN